MSWGGYGRILLLGFLAVGILHSGIGCNAPAGGGGNGNESEGGETQGNDNGSEGGGAECASEDCPDGQTCEGGQCVAEDQGSGDGGSDGPAWVTFTLDDGVYWIQATEGAEAENVSTALNALASGFEDDSLNISPNGEWLVLNSDRFDLECNGWPCLSVIDFNLTSADAVSVGGEVIHVDAPGADPFSAISNDGEMIVFPSGEGPNIADLFVTTRENGSWSEPRLLTGDSQYDYHSQPAISADGSTVVFDCGDGEYSNPPAAVCEVGTDGRSFRVVITTEGRPEWDGIGCSLHHPDYAPDGSIVAEPGCQIWQISPGSDSPTLVATEFFNDNSPCVLPDGRIASLWLDRPGGSGVHEIKIMDADGRNSFVVLSDIEVIDIGIGCGGGTGDTPTEPDTTPGDSRSPVTFPASSVWYEDISSATLDEQSDAVIEWLEGDGGWGFGRMQIDFSIEVLTADDSTEFEAFTPTEDHFSPDCDIADLPIPDGGAIEGEGGYECVNDGDCHLIVVHEPTNTLYEMWRANIVDGKFFGGCLAVWDLTRDYGAEGRGLECTSADAAGFPIAPLLFSADEVAAGSIDHAIRFILPNERIRERVYVQPATHSTGATSGPNTAPPYGARFRLRADYPLGDLPNEGARVVARAMQKYGIVLADAGNVALTAQSDRFTTAKWAGLLESRDLDIIQVSDFEMIDTGTQFTWTGDCVRKP